MQEIYLITLKSRPITWIIKAQNFPNLFELQAMELTLDQDINGVRMELRSHCLLPVRIF